MKKNICIIAAITIALYYLVDMVYGVLFPYNPKPYENYPERLTSSAYINEPYFSEAFLSESFAQFQPPGGWVTPEGTILVFPKEYQGTYFHTDRLGKSTYRRTINRYPPFDPGVTTVLLLGGSTIHCAEVPDEFTVASLLASRLNDELQPHKFAVLNAGVTSVNSTQELARLEWELNNGVRPDIVVVYDGVNDILQGIYFDNPQGVMFSSAKKQEWEYRIKRLKEMVLPRNIYKTIKRKQLKRKRLVPPNMQDDANVAAKARQTAAIYRRNIEAMQRLADQYGFRFYCCLQPNFFTGNFTHRTADLAEVAALNDKNSPLMDKAFTVGYPLLQEVVAELRAQGMAAYDLTHIFDDKKDNIFIDFCHVNSIGNRIIAEHLAKIIAAGAPPAIHQRSAP